MVWCVYRGKDYLFGDMVYMTGELNIKGAVQHHYAKTANTVDER